MAKSPWWEEMEAKNRYTKEESEFEKEELVDFYLTELSEDGIEELDNPNSIGNQFLSVLGVTKEEALEDIEKKTETDHQKRH